MIAISELPIDYRISHISTITERQNKENNRKTKMKCIGQEKHKQNEEKPAMIHLQKTSE